MEELVTGMMDAMCGTSQTFSTRVAPRPSPVLTSLPEEILDLIRDELTFNDLTHVMDAFPTNVQHSTDQQPTLVSTKALLTAYMKENDNNCEPMKQYAYDLRLLSNSDFPSTRRWCRILKNINNRNRGAGGKETSCCEMCGSQKNDVSFLAYCNLFLCEGKCNKMGISAVGDLLKTNNTIEKLSWSEEQRSTAPKFRIVSLPSFALKKHHITDQFTGERIGPIFTTKEICEFDMKEISRRLPTIYEQAQSLDIITHFLTVRGSMEHWTPVTALLVAHHHILAKYQGQQQLENSDGETGPAPAGLEAAIEVAPAGVPAPATGDSEQDG